MLCPLPPHTAAHLSTVTWPCLRNGHPQICQEVRTTSSASQDTAGPRNCSSGSWAQPWGSSPTINVPGTWHQAAGQRAGGHRSWTERPPEAWVSVSRAGSQPSPARVRVPGVALPLAPFRGSPGSHFCFSARRTQLLASRGGAAPPPGPWLRPPVRSPPARGQCEGRPPGGRRARPRARRGSAGLLLAAAPGEAEAHPRPAAGCGLGS